MITRVRNIQLYRRQRNINMEAKSKKRTVTNSRISSHDQLRQHWYIDLFLWQNKRQHVYQI